VTQPTQSPTTGASRRDFLATSAVAVAGASLAALPSLGNVHAAGSDVLKIGLIGCGDRGTGAATQALNADPHTKLVAMGDMFPDHLDAKLKALKEDPKVGDRVDVKPDDRFIGFNAYKKVLAADVDVVILTTPPHFRPLHLKAAVEAGKHIFCEKPVAVDAPGLRSVIETCRIAKDKNLALVSGLCYRYERSKRETMARIHDGAIGDIVALHTNYNAHGLWKVGREKRMTDMEWQLRNWLYFTWLSGDHIVEQHIHSLDKMAWAMKDKPPLKAVGLGGRQSRIGEEFGYIFDHHAVVFEYDNGVKLFSYCRQQDRTAADVNDYVIGTQGVADIMKHSIKGKNDWKAKKEKNDDMYQNEHDELFASIRAGKPIQNGDYMTKSTLMAIMGRMATYTGQVITWDMAMNSKEDMTPPVYEFGPLPIPDVARPGVTKFI
jgi:myo-inositol 2-dehydrogenase / D-chiro-inositol 1-dehydrogenase